jgi:hypothetical protein
MARQQRGKTRNKTPDDVYAEIVGQVQRAAQRGALEIRLGRGRRNFQRIPDLSGLQRLQKLDLSGTGVVDIGNIAVLSSLRELDLGWTKVTDLNPLSDLRSLQRLNLTSVPVSNLEPLKNLTELRSLAMGGTEIVDLSPLRNLKKLQELIYPYGSPDDWTVLAELGSLRALSLFRAQLYDGSWLKNLVNLIELSIEGTHISDLSPIEGLSELQQLRISGTDVSDLSPIKDLRKLSLLIFSRTPVSNLDAVKNLRQLKYLFFDETEVSDMGPLAELEWFTSSARLRDGGGLSFKGCPLGDPVLLRLAEKFNPDRTIETMAYLRQARGLPVRHISREIKNQDGPTQPLGEATGVSEPHSKAVERATQWDFFLSYSAQDEVFARWVDNLLRSVGLRVFSQFGEIRPGSNFVREMQYGLAQSERFIALLSPHYINSDHCQAEWSAVYNADAGGKDRKLIQFLIRPTELPPLAKQIVYKSLVGLSSVEISTAILQAVGYYGERPRIRAAWPTISD